MCCRFTLFHSDEELDEWFELHERIFGFPARYNIAPSQPIAVVLEHEGSRVLDACRWGLVPFWAKSADIGNKLLNARLESAAEKPAFKHALAKRRCLIPADGFYEWRRGGKQSQPMYVHRPDGTLFAFAGLWEEWQAPDGSPLRSCTILTREANKFMQPIHERMPVIVPREHHAAWLDHTRRPTELMRLLEDAPELEAYPVSKEVNNAQADSPALIQQVIEAVTPTTLSLWDEPILN